MGTPFSYMPDVSGFAISKLWGDTQLGWAHSFALDLAGCKASKRSKKIMCGRGGISGRWRKDKAVFNTQTKFKKHFAEFAVDSSGTFGFIQHHCDPALILNEPGREKMTITTQEVWGQKSAINRSKRFYINGLFKHNADNACLFLN
jgi:hypothetical protein